MGSTLTGKSESYVVELSVLLEFMKSTALSCNVLLP